MAIGFVMLILAAALLGGLMFQQFGERHHLPLAAILVASGFLASQVIHFFGLGNGINHELFHELIVYAFLPVLVFSAAFRIDVGRLRKNLWLILFLSIPGLLISLGIVAILVYYGIAHPTGFPWIAALITGAVISATDASPITSHFPRLQVPKRLRVLLEGEDLFNDATAIVVFGILTYIALHPVEDIGLMDVLVRFLVIFFGGALIGLLTGLVFLLLSRLFDDHMRQALVTLIASYTAYLLAHDVLHVSGIMAVLVIGLVMGRVIHHDFQDERGTFVDNFWDFSAFAVESVMFVLTGMILTPGMFEQRWLAILIGITALVIGRTAVVTGTAVALKRSASHAIEPTSQRILVGGSLRGVVVLALALALPTSLPYWWTIQSIAFGVVVFSLFVQAPLTLRALSLKESG